MERPPRIQPCRCVSAPCLQTIKRACPRNPSALQCTGANPRYPTIADLRQILLDAWDTPILPLTTLVRCCCILTSCCWLDSGDTSSLRPSPVPIGCHVCATLHAGVPSQEE